MGTAKGRTEKGSGTENGSGPNSARKKGSGPNSAKHPQGRSGYWDLTPFSGPGLSSAGPFRLLGPDPFSVPVPTDFANMGHFAAADWYAPYITVVRRTS